jgi:hypothetical protein
MDPASGSVNFYKQKKRSGHYASTAALPRLTQGLLAIHNHAFLASEKERVFWL